MSIRMTEVDDKKFQFFLLAGHIALMYSNRMSWRHTWILTAENVDFGEATNGRKEKKKKIAVFLEMKQSGSCLIQKS